MVKERKPQTGASNLNSSRLTSTKNGKPANESNFVRTLSHRVIASEKHAKPNTTNKKERTIKGAATWGPSEVYERDFTSTHHASYLNPIGIADDPHKFRSLTTEQIATQNEENRIRRMAVENMVKIAKSTHGTMASMLRSVRIYIQCL
jgi:hypothetical protein